MSLGESNLRPTAMLFRNLVSMDVEESIRANPIDGVVLLTGCDKTTPALLMGAASCDLPTIVLSGGPMLTGRFRGQRARLRHRRVQVFGRAPRRQHVAGRLRRRRIRHVAQPRPLHDHGHRVDDGEHGRSARHRDGGQRRDPGRRFPPQRARAARRPPRRGIGPRRHPYFADSHPPGVRERDPRERRHRRLDQRGRPPPRHCRPARRPAQPRRLGHARAQRADHRQPHAFRPISDGGLLLRRRPARGDPPPRRSDPHGCANR